MNEENCHDCKPMEQIFEKKPTKIESIKYQIYNLAKSKTVFCRHEGGCISNCVLGSFKSFYLGYLIRLIINLLVLLAFKKDAKKK